MPAWPGLLRQSRPEGGEDPPLPPTAAPRCSQLFGEAALEPAEDPKGEPDQADSEDDDCEVLPQVPPQPGVVGQDPYEAVRTVGQSVARWRRLAVEGPLEGEHNRCHRIEAVEVPDDVVDAMRVFEHRIMDPLVLHQDRRGPEPNLESHVQEMR